MRVAGDVLRFDPANVAACRIMAETAEAAGKREAVSWREQILALEPGVVANKLALASAGLQFGQLDLARQTLGAMDAAARNSAQYHQISAVLAVAEKKETLAETEFAAAVEFDPENEQLALSLATLRLTSEDAATKAKALSELARLSEKPNLRLEALRALTSDGLATTSEISAEKWAAQLKSEKGATFGDLLLYLEAIQKTDAAPAAFRDVEAAAARSPATVAALITWMNRHKLAQPALDWAFTLPKEILSVQPVPLAIAEADSVLENWSGLESWVDGKNWGEDEFLRLALVSHAVYHLTADDRASMELQAAWAAALKATRNRADRLSAIAQLAEGWGYPEEAASAWWLIANGNENARDALVALQRLYKTKQNSHGLLRVAKRALELNPADLVAANNCAHLGLLLNGDRTAHRLAAKLHAENPTNAALSSTYAFALLTEGKTNAALRQMETLKEAQLRQPAIAPYYFVMLVEEGKMERAHLFLSAANRAQLLPEEQRLLTAATRKLLQYDSQTVMKTAAAEH